MKFLSVIGTRPQWVKILELDNHVIVNTGQHYDYEMDTIFKRQLKIKPKYNLKVTELGEMIDKCKVIIQKENPDIVIVYGDTNSTLAGALAAKLAGKTLAHVESGMRSYDIKQPEEVTRVIVDRIADYRFCANKHARDNLKREGIYDNIFVVGDPMWDALNTVLPMPKTKDSGTYGVLTMHRAQNVENKEFIQNVFNAIEKSKVRFIFPVHPRTKRNIKKFKIKIPSSIKIVKPQGYKEMIKLLTNCAKVVTDSGGIQREAYWFGKPVIILRWETEWNEIVEDNWGVLVGDNTQKITEAIREFNPQGTRNFIPAFGAKIKMAELLNG